MASLPLQPPQLTSPPPSMPYASTSTAANQPPSTSSSSASSNKHALPDTLNQANEINSKKKKLKSEHMMCTDTATQQHEADGGAGFTLNINRDGRDNSMSSISQHQQQESKSDTEMNHTKQKPNNDKLNIDAEGFDKEEIERALSAHNKEVIELLDDSDIDGEEEDTKPAAKKIESSTAAGEPTTNTDLEKDIEKAIMLSKQDQQKQTYEGMDRDLMLIKRQELQDAIDSYVNLYGGYENIEKSRMIRDGNEGSIKKVFAAENWLGLKQQRGAQYGRYGIEALWRMFDMLEGKVNEDDNIITSCEVNEDCKLPAADRGVKSERKTKEDGLVGKPITAFLDIGHGLGIQVIQAAWALQVPSRGVEVMVQRDVIANHIRDGVHDILCHDPPDKTKLEFKQADFASALVPNKHTGARDEKLLDFLLFRDKPRTVQEGLVIFINNAEDVFAKRNYEDADTKSLDHYLALCFAHMQVGGRMVTLTDVSMHLPCQRDWYRRDTLDSGPNAVSWHLDNKKSVTLYVLTKLSDEWYCDNQCPLATAVVDDYGDLSGYFVCCSFPAMRRSSERRRKK